MNTEAIGPIETLRWRDGRLEMIDQRVLPAQFGYVACDSAADVAQAIRSMVVRGAPAIGCAAAYGMALEAQRWQGSAAPAFDVAMAAALDLLAASRPTAVNLFWALAQMRECLAQQVSRPVPERAAALLQLAHQILADDVRINRALGGHGAELLADGARVLTHCNAGALATAGHGTALGVIRSAVQGGKRIHVIADETRPFLQGARLTAWEMVQEGIPVTLITDNMAGFMMSRGEVDAVVVGADRVAANGDVANKIGTYMVAVLARHHGIPFYVACPLSTIDPGTPDGHAIPIEERAADEVTGYRGQRWAAEGVRVRNPSFDVTPAGLVSALITERGLLHQPDAVGIAALMAG